MGLDTNTRAGVTALNPVSLAPINAFGGSRHHDQIQQGYDFNNANLDDVATLLGQQGYAPSYDSNTQGSFEGNYNQILNRLNPDQLVKRYSQGQDSQYNTSLDQLQASAYQNAKSILGRDINAQEFSQILPAFQGPNGLINGRAFLSNMAQQEQSNPQNPNSQFNPNNPNNKLQQYSGPVAQQFQSILGRAPTQEEMSHFSSLLGSNQIDQYGLASFLKQQPEATNAQDKTFRQGLNQELTGYDTNAFNRQKQDVISQFMKNGTYGSSALDSALTDLMGQIADKRSSFLSNLSAQQYGGNKDLATRGYQSTLDQLYNQNQQTRQQQQGYGQQLLNQGFAGADYQTQRNDYMNYMNQNRGRSGNPIAGAIGGLVGAGIGSFGGPAGASAGYQVGQGAGNLYGYLNY